jgi:aspartyl-tRNA synthetase
MLFFKDIKSFKCLAHCFLKKQRRKVLVGLDATKKKKKRKKWSYLECNSFNMTMAKTGISKASSTLLCESLKKTLSMRCKNLCFFLSSNEDEACSILAKILVNIAAHSASVFGIHCEVKYRLILRSINHLM